MEVGGRAGLMAGQRPGPGGIWPSGAAAVRPLTIVGEITRRRPAILPGLAGPHRAGRLRIICIMACAPRCRAGCGRRPGGVSPVLVCEKRQSGCRPCGLR